MYDLMIIGGGPAGYVAAERAGHNGLSVVLFEKKSMGGVCLNEGCIPTKTLLYSAKTYDNVRHADKYGVTAANAAFDFSKITTRKDRVVRRLVAGVESKMKAHNVQVVKGEAVIQGKTETGFQVLCNDAIFEGKNLLICTGSEAFVPPIPGLKEAGDLVLTNREILTLKEQPAELVVVGGGVIGMEFASFYNSLGTKVTVIEMLPEILGGIDSEISALLREQYSRKGVAFHTSAKVTRVESGTVFFEKDQSEFSVSADKILVSVGRRPVISNFGLEKLDVQMNKGGIAVDAYMRTSVPGLFAAGDVTGFSLLAHTASREGEVVVNYLINAEDPMDYRAIPGVVYTNPEVASVGMTLKEAESQGLPVKEVKLPMAFSGRFVAENDGVNGLCKTVINTETGEILGLHMLGNPCSELIFGACIAIGQKMSVTQLQRIVFPHPTVSEIFRESVF